MDDAQIELARQVHYAFLPSDYVDDSFDVTVTAVPHAGLGGDYCGIAPLADGKLVLTMCDATGHDIASALFAARINTYVLSRLGRTQSPCELVDSLHGFLANRMQGTNMQATFCAAVLDPRAQTWDFAGAGHPPAIHYRAATGDTAIVSSQTIMVGVLDSIRAPATTTTTSLAVGDRVVLHTDGLIDARSTSGSVFGLERLQECMVEHAALTGPAFHEALFAAARAHAGGALDDDALLVTTTRR